MSTSRILANGTNRILRLGIGGFLSYLVFGTLGGLLDGRPAGICFGGVAPGPPTTPVQCAQATGVAQMDQFTLVLLCVITGLMIGIFLPPQGSRLGSTIWAGLGVGIASAGGLLVLQPRTMQGYLSTGELLSVARPLDPLLILGYAIFVGVLGGLAWAHILAPLVRSRRAVRSVSGTVGA